MRIWVAVEPADFRAGIDGLCRVCRKTLSSDPMSGAVFVFRNRRAKALKILVYDGQGFWLCQKRLSSGRFRFWPSAPGKNPALTGRLAATKGHAPTVAVGDCRGARPLQAHELQVLLACGNPEAAKGAPLWRPVEAA